MREKRVHGLTGGGWKRSPWATAPVPDPTEDVVGKEAVGDDFNPSHLG
ncbi:hypothetical protein GCM10022223_25360 [Kineosporia mesophila]|uniref:Uncharacterized protein n=1 Tax=Kineosporia mesophila TaxID=566012 RepID=A0ABP6ZHW5_9ACTN